MSMLNWQWQAQLSLPLSTAVHARMGKAGAEREPDVGSNQAEFNEGKVGQTIHRPLPIPLAHGPEEPEAAGGNYGSYPRQVTMVPWTLCKILNANLALRAGSEKGIILCAASPRGKGRLGGPWPREKGKVRRKKPLGLGDTGTGQVFEHSSGVEGDILALEITDPHLQCPRRRNCHGRHWHWHLCWDCQFPASSRHSACLRV